MKNRGYEWRGMDLVADLPADSKKKPRGQGQALRVLTPFAA